MNIFFIFITVNVTMNRKYYVFDVFATTGLNVFKLQRAGEAFKNY